MKPISSVDLGPYNFSTYAHKPRLEGALYEVIQTHSADILNWQTPDLATQEADGIYLMFDQVNKSYSKPINIGIKTADCLGVVILGDKGVVNLHAGWRGLAANILFDPIIKECRPHTFYLSAAIACENYEVGEEFNEIFKQYPEGLKIINRKLTFSLHTTATKMINSQYPDARVLADSLDTFSHPKLNSYRRTGTSSRNWNVLSLNFSG